MFKKISFFILVMLSLNVNAQPMKETELSFYPTNWFVQMKWNKVQLLLRSTTINLTKASIQVKYPGVRLLKINSFKNKNYVALDIEISPTAQPGNVKFEIEASGKLITQNWNLLKRRPGKGTVFAQGVNQSDFIYFLMPDRFSNGDKTNDQVNGLKDQSLDRSKMYDRHGGDMQGVINHLDYLQKMGATTLWMTPVIENDMPNRTEHGYAFTDHYVIEKRFGAEATYKKLSDSLHGRGMKLIQDAVYNHVGSYHVLVQDAPDENWLHQWPTYTQTNYKDQAIFDPYQAPSDFKKMANGWFVKEMPDMNHENIFVQNFLIQHALWSVETFGIDAWRIDTYIYNGLEFMNRCNKVLTDEYPKLTSFGECWSSGMVNQAYYVENIMNTPFKSNLQGTVDFQLLFNGIQPALNDKAGWSDGVNKLYNTLSNDILYKDATRNVIFLDNHDMSRTFSTFGESISKVKMAVGWLMTCRGIPQLYYGTELLMKGFSNPDGLVRSDFPGGWEEDKISAFTEIGLTIAEKDMLHYTQTLGNFRKNSSAITTGKMMQFAPNDGLYVYFRYDKKQTLMCVMNTNTAEKTVKFNTFEEMTQGFTGGKEIVSGSSIKREFTIAPQTMKIIELTQ